jgi:polar amino acid transport system substrate-binding protein
VRPSDEELLGGLNAVLEAIQTDGTYDTISAKYFPFNIR